MTVYNTYTLLRLRDAVGPIVTANLDPSHLFWQGMDPLAVIAALGDAIGFVHAKDTLIDRTNLALNGMLDSRWPGRPAEMPWYFGTMGYGHDAGFWKSFVLKLRAHGYDGVLSIEHEDPLLAPLDGVRKSVRFLEMVVPDE
jgi:sugar phosphate isomerase/epimerase